MQCTSCKKHIVNGAPFCSHCGTSANAAAPSASPSILIGRDATCAFRLQSPRTSQRHASLTPQGDDTFLLQDIGSSNGTSVSSPSNKVQSAVVRLDDTIYFADEAIKVSSIVGAKAAPARQQGAVKRLRIGRASDNDIVLDDASVSRHHAILEQKADGTWWIEDCGSSNGTFVNGKKVSHISLTLTDSIYCGKHHLPSYQNIAIPQKYAHELLRKREQDSHIEPISQSLLQRLLNTQAFMPCVLTVICACVLAIKMREGIEGAVDYVRVFGFYIGAMSGLLILSFTRRRHDWYVPILVATFVFFLLDTPIFYYFAHFFRNVLPGNIGLLNALQEKGVNISLAQRFVAYFFGAGLCEELFKAIPIFLGVWCYKTLQHPYKNIFGVKDRLDGITWGICAGIGFALNETLYDYFNPNSLAVEALKYKNIRGLPEVIFGAKMFSALQLTIARTLWILSGHAAYAGMLGYAIGALSTDGNKAFKNMLLAYILISMLHALWNTLAGYSIVYMVAISVGSMGALVYWILRARQDAGIPLSIANFSRRHKK